MQNPRSFRDLVDYFTATDTHDDAPLVRRWGYEIETPEVGRFAYTLEDLHFTCTHDGSVMEPDCDCDCDSCSHDCNCDNCAINNGWNDPDHCDSCRTNEASSPVQFYAKAHPKVAEVLADLHEANTEDMENGGHIHIEGRDLSITQIETIIKLWERLVDTMPEITGRHRNEYCERNSDYGDTVERLCVKMRAVNASGLVRTDWGASNPFTWTDQDKGLIPQVQGRHEGRRTTLEFREFASTASYPVIHARASIVRALVDYVAQGHAPYWLLRCQTGAQWLEELKPEEH